MSPLEGPVEELEEKHVDLVLKFVSDIRNRKLEECNDIALATLSLLEQIISELPNATVLSLCGAVRAAGRLAGGAAPGALAAANTARRVLRAIRDEQRAAQDQLAHHTAISGGGASLQGLVQAAGRRRGAPGACARDLREPLRDQLAELRAELESTWSSVCAGAASQVHADELVLTFGASALCERYLRAAAPRRYRLILAEGDDVRECHSMAARLSTAGVAVTVVHAAAAAALMARVNKVIVCVRAALAGGGALGAPGLHAVTVAAHHYSVPVVALAPLVCLTPQFASDARLAAPHAPAAALPYESAENARALAPAADFVPPAHISLYITNLGGSSPSYIYRLLAELYDPADYVL